MMNSVSLLIKLLKMQLFMEYAYSISANRFQEYKVYKLTLFKLLFKSLYFTVENNVSDST